MFRYRNVVITLSCVGVVDERQNIRRAVPLLYTLTDRRGNLRPLPTQQVVADNAGGISRAGSTAYPRMRGRVISLFIMSSLGAIPIGSVFVGFVAGYLPTEICMAAQGVICLIIAFVFKSFLHENYLTRT